MTLPIFGNMPCAGGCGRTLYGYMVPGALCPECAKKPPQISELPPVSLPPLDMVQPDPARYPNRAAASRFTKRCAGCDAFIWSIKKVNFCEDCRHSIAPHMQALTFIRQLVMRSQLTDWPANEFNHVLGITTLPVVVKWQDAFADIMVNAYLNDWRAQGGDEPSAA